MKKQDNQETRNCEQKDKIRIRQKKGEQQKKDTKRNSKVKVKQQRSCNIASICVKEEGDYTENKKLQWKEIYRS